MLGGCLQGFIQISGILILHIVYGKDSREIKDKTGCLSIILSLVNFIWIMSVLSLFFEKNIVLPLIVSIGYPSVIAIWAVIARKNFRESNFQSPLHTATNIETKKQEDAEDSTETTPIINENLNVTAEIRQYKELLDIGAISQEEYDAKKRQLLGLPGTPVQKQIGISPKKKGKYLTCPNCGRTQLSSRSDCWNCGRVFEEQDYEYE